MSISRLVTAALFVALVAPPAPAGRVEQAPERANRVPEVSCEACIVVSDAGDVLFRRRPDAEIPNASTTKMMTALLVERAGVVGETVIISQEAASIPGGPPTFAAGESWSAETLLQALLLASSNGAAVALAEHVAGSTAAFVEDMNDEADAIGLKHTRFATPHGLDTPGHYSSARDLVTIAELLLEEPTLRGMVDEAEVNVEGPSGRLLIENRNLLLESYQGAIGVKTGYTLDAGNALVSAAERGGRTLIGVVLRADDSFADSRALLDYGFRRLRRTVLLGRGETVGTIVLDPAGSVSAVSERVARGLAPADDIDVAFEPVDDFAPPVDVGEVVGRVTVRWHGRVIDRMDATAANELEEQEASWIARGLATVVSWGRRMTSSDG